MGEGVFANRCKACHEVANEKAKEGQGPSLKGLFGRTAGSVPGFAYSDAMKAAGFTWDEDKLKAYLINPKALVPNNKMVFNGLKREGEMENLIAYLKEATK